MLLIVQSVFVFAFIYLTGALGHKVQYDMRKTMFQHLQELSLSYYNRTPVGWIMSRLTSDTERIADLVTWGMLDMTWAIIDIFTALIFMLTINWQLALLVFAVVPVLVVVASWFQSEIMVQYRIARKANSKITGAYNENITGVRVIKALGREERNLDEFGVLTENMYRSSYRAAWLSALFLPAVQIISAVALGSVVYFGGLQVRGGDDDHRRDSGVHHLRDLHAVARAGPGARLRLDAVRDCLRRAHLLADRLESRKSWTSRTRIDPGTISGDIVFEHVDFYYDDEVDKPVLTDFNLHVKRGETIALVGPTGAGKSTVVNLICRFFEPRGGRITIGGHRLHRHDAARHPVADRHGAANAAPVQRHDPREHPLRQARRDRRGDRGGGAVGGRARVHHHAGKGLR